jgi:hypothetical protein
LKWLESYEGRMISSSLSLLTERDKLLRVAGVGGSCSSVVGAKCGEGGTEDGADEVIGLGQSR